MKSPWVIAIVGVLAFALVCFLMLLALQNFEKTPAGNFAKLAQDVSTRFDHESTMAELTVADGKPILRIEYRTGRAVPDATRRETEMREVGAYAIEHYSGIPEKARVHAIDVLRHEVHGSGCFRDEQTHSLQMENPLKPKWTNPFDIDD